MLCGACSAANGRHCQKPQTKTPRRPSWFDDRGNRMSPSHAAKGRYGGGATISRQAVLHGRKHRREFHLPAPSLEVEKPRVAEAAPPRLHPASKSTGLACHASAEKAQPATAPSTDSASGAPIDYEATLRRRHRARSVIRSKKIENRACRGMAIDDRIASLISPGAARPLPSAPRKITQGEGCERRRRPMGPDDSRAAPRFLQPNALRDAHPVGSNRLTPVQPKHPNRSPDARKQTERFVIADHLRSAFPLPAPRQSRRNQAVDCPRGPGGGGWGGGFFKRLDVPFPCGGLTIGFRRWGLRGARRT